MSRLRQKLRRCLPAKRKNESESESGKQSPSNLSPISRMSLDKENRSEFRDNIVPTPLNCGRCDRQIVGQKYYHCLGCVKRRTWPAGEGYNLCLDCATVGIYCAYDNHAWSSRLLKRTRDGQRWVNAGDYMPPMQVRTLPHAVRKIYPARFCPPQEGWLPEEMFYDDHRFIRASDPREILIYTGGAILHRRRGGRREYAGGFAFGYRATTFARNGNMTQKGTISGRLENLGPTGRRQPFTQDRADLRAIVAALQFLPWNMDCNRGWRSLVIATASKYVVNNATKGTIPRAWETEGETPPGMELYEFTNEDLWKLMISEIRKLQEDGVQVRFWRTPKGGDYNGGIDRCVRYAQRAALGNEQEEYQIVEAADPWLPPPSPSQPESSTQTYEPLGAPDNIILHEDMRHLY